MRAADGDRLGAATAKILLDGWFRPEPPGPRGDGRAFATAEGVMVACAGDEPVPGDSSTPRGTS